MMVLAFSWMAAFPVPVSGDDGEQPAVAQAVGAGVTLTLVLENPERRFGEPLRGHASLVRDDGSAVAGHGLFEYTAQRALLGESRAGCPGWTDAEGRYDLTAGWVAHSLVGTYYVGVEVETGGQVLDVRLPYTMVWP